MIGKPVLAALAVATLALPSGAQTLPTNVQEMVDKVHLGAGGKLVAVEEVPAVFERADKGDLKHRPSGFVCQHARGTLDGLMPGFVTIFDDPPAGENIGCGMIGRGINISIFVSRRDGDPASVIEHYAAPARAAMPPVQDAEPVAPATAYDLELTPGAPFAADVWVDRGGQVQSIYVTKAGDWFVAARLTSERMMTREGLRHVARQFDQAQKTIGK